MEHPQTRGERRSSAAVGSFEPISRHTPRRRTPRPSARTPNQPSATIERGPTRVRKGSVQPLTQTRLTLPYPGQRRISTCKPCEAGAVPTDQVAEPHKVV